MRPFQLQVSMSLASFVAGILLVIAPASQAGAAGECPAGWTYEAAGGTCYQAFTASTTWTPPAGVTSISYFVVGGGGGGQGQVSGTTKGGMGGQVKTGTLSIGSTAITITVGAGGGGGNPGSTGGASKLTQSAVDLLTSAGGAGGTNSVSGAGTGTTSSFSGTSRVYGANGAPYRGTAGTNAGIAAVSSTDNCVGGGNGTANYGGGGGAGDYCAFSFGGGSYTVGGNGGSGIVMIRFTAFSVSGFSSVNAASTNSSGPFTYSLSFTGNVDASTISATDFRNGGTATCTYSVSPTTGTASTFTVTASNCTDGTVVPRLVASSVTSTGGTTGPGADVDGSTITVDTTAPSAPGAIDLAAASDLGASSTDNVTKDDTPTMSATGGASGDTMTITATNGTTTKTCSYILPATSCDLPALSDGTWSTSATLTDPAGNISSAGPSTPVTIDTTAPSASAPDLLPANDTGTSNTDNLTKDSAPAFTVPGAQVGDSVTVSAVNGGTTKTCSYTVTASVTSCAMSGLTAGTWSVTSVVTDPAGNASPTSPASSVTLDTTAPTAPTAVDLATTSDLGSSSTDNATSDNTPTMSASGGSAGDTMTITAAKGSDTVSCSYLLPASSCDLPALADGTWSVTATLTDPAGNVSTSGSALSMTIDTASAGAPSSPDMAAASDSGSSGTDNVTNDTTPTMSATGGASGDKVTITATDGTNYVSCSYTIGLATSCDLPTLTPGDWSSTATITDPSGNVSPPSSPLNFTIDSAAPSPSVPDLVSASDTGSSDSDNVTKDTTPTVSLAGGSSGDTVTFTATDGTNTVSCSYTVGTATSCDLPTLTPGTWSVTGSFTDRAGNVSPSSSPLSLVLDTTAPSAPSTPDMAASSDTGPSNTDNVTNDATPTVSAPGGSSGDTMTVTATKGTDSVSCSYVLPAASCDLPALSDGTWTLTATLTDPAGNVSASSAPLSVTIDATPPGSPTGLDLAATSDTGASPTDNHTNDTTPTMSASGGSPGDTMTITATKGTEVVSCSYVLPAASCDLPGLSDGTWSVTAMLTDPLGNVSSAAAPLQVTVDSAATVPVAPALDPASDTGVSRTDNVTGDLTPTVGVANAAIGDVVTVSATGPDGAVRSCTYTVPVAAGCDLPALSIGTWSVAADIVDLAGNVSRTSPITIVTTAPPDDRRIVTSGLPPAPANVIVKRNGATGTSIVSANVRAVHPHMPADTVVFVVQDSAGRVRGTFERRVMKNQTVVSTILSIPVGGRVVVYTRNKWGVSSNSPRLGGVVRDRTHERRLIAGTGDAFALIGEVFSRAIIFDPASSALDRTDRSILDEAVRFLRGRNGSVMVTGFARQNLRDTAEFLKNLSVQRARAVSNYLSRRGVKCWIRYSGLGAVTSKEGGPRERRVELRWVSGG